VLTIIDITLQNGDILQPDKSYTLENPRIPLPTQPDGTDYPAIVFEMANTERLSDMLNKCRWWLSDQTSVNVWVGVKYERSRAAGDRAGDRWWMGVATRNVNPGIKPANLPPDQPWPAPVWLSSLPHNGLIPALPILAGPLPLLSTVQNLQWTIPIATIIQPLAQIPPPLPPPANQQFPDLILHPDLFRGYILRYRKP
jgi:hypothetical protein